MKSEITYNNTHTIGDIGESIALYKFTECGIKVSIPFTSNVPYDYIIDCNGDLYKVQVKTTKTVKDYKMKFEINRTNPYRGKTTQYTADEIDLFFLHCIENEWCGLIGVEDCTSKQLILNLIDSAYDIDNYKLARDYTFNKQVLKLFKMSGINRLSNNSMLDEEINISKRKVKPHISKINEVNRDELKELVRHNTFVDVGDIYGVTDNTIKKWCIHYSIPSRRKDISILSDDEWNTI